VGETHRLRLSAFIALAGGVPIKELAEYLGTWLNTRPGR
jgi:hypothetical protein